MKNSTSAAPCSTKALQTLDRRERDILTARRLKDRPDTLDDLSQVYGISRERVRQIEIRAVTKLQKRMQAVNHAESIGRLTLTVLPP